MAEAAVKQKSESQQESSRTEGARKKLLDLGLMAISTFISGACLAAGGHAYQSIARNLGGKPSPADNVTALRRVV